jgi:hypothetical protein
MASAVATDKFATTNCVEMFYHAPADAATEQSVKAGATTATWKDLRDYDGFAVGALTALKVGNGMIELSIYAADDTSGTNAIEVKTSGAVAADAIGDWVFLECSAEEIRQLASVAGTTLRYVVGYVDCHHNDDEVAVVYIRHGAKHPQDTLTAATTIA